MGPMAKESQRYLNRNKAVNLLKMAEGTPVYLRPYRLKNKKNSTVQTIVSAKRDKGFLEVTFDCEEPLMDKVVAYERPQDYKGI